MEGLPSGSWVYWLIGLITAFITSFYMFRLWYMTFFGDYRGAKVDAHGHGSHGHDEHGHGEPHESPMVMLVPLDDPGGAFAGGRAGRDRQSF